MQFIYFGETWIDSNKTMEFVEVIHFLELLCTCCGPLVACIGFEEEEEDDVSEGYIEFSRDPASIGECLLQIPYFSIILTNEILMLLFVFISLV